MSYTNTTPNYDLPQFEASDRMTPVADFNGAFSAIDTALKTNADNIADMDSDVADAKSDAENALSTANSVASTANNALLQAQTANTTAGNALSTANGAVTTANSASALAEASAENLADEFDSSETYSVGDYVIYEGVLYKCTVAHTGDFVSADFTAVKIVDEMGQGGGGSTGSGTYKSLAVTGDGVKTYGALFSELYTAFATDVGDNEIIVDCLTLDANDIHNTYDANDHRKQTIDTYYTFNRVFGRDEGSSTSKMQIATVDLSNDNPTWFYANLLSTGTVTVGDNTSGVASDGYEIKLYYRVFE